MSDCSSDVCSSDLYDVLDTHELRLQLRLAVFKKHRDDFLQISVQLLKRLALRVRASESRDKPDEKTGLGATLNDGRVASHDVLRQIGRASCRERVCQYV